MPSTYTNNLGIQKPGTGEQSGTWGDTVNTNSDILDVGINGVLSLSLTGTSSTLTTSDGVVSNGQYKALALTGTPSGTHTITVSPNDAQKIYFVYNTTAQTVVFTQGSGGNVTLLAGDSTIIYANGAGSTSAVVSIADHLAMSSARITGGSITGITDLAVADGGTGASDAATARTNLGLVIGTNVQAYDAALQSISGLTTTADRMIYTTASDTYAVTTLTSYARTLLDDADAATSRTTLGLGTIATQASSAVAITGGTINGTSIGASTASTGAFTTLTGTAVTGSTSVTTPSVTNAGTLALSATGANVITASTNGSERVRITSDGNVGIGTNAPVSKETIVTAATAGTVIGLNINNPYGYGVGLGLAAAGIRFNRSPTDAGSTGVMADIYASNTTETSSTNGYLVFATRSGASEVTVERMRIFASGGVSIGNTTDPGATNLSVTGALSVGGALTLGTDLSVANGGTGASDAATARSNLGLAIGTNVQAYDATLQSLSSLGTTADRVAYTTGVDTWSETAVTSFGRSLIDDADAAAARTTLGLGTMATQAASAVAITGGTASNTQIQGGSVTSGTAWTYASPVTTIDFTSIPSWVKRITVMFSKVSTNGSDSVVARIGTSSGIEATTYDAVALLLIPGSGTALVSTTAFPLDGPAGGTYVSGASVRQGSFTLSNITGNTWVISGQLGMSNPVGVVTIYGGTKTLAGVLDRVRITTAAGTDSFDAGTINVLYEG